MKAQLWRSVRRGENVTGKIMIVGYLMMMAAAAFLGRELVGVICLIGFLHELNRIEFANLRREIRAKKMWHGGEA